MKFLEVWMESPLSGAIGWTLLHSLWEGIIISAVLAAVLILLHPPRARYLAACVAMLLLFISFGATLVWMMPDDVHGLRTIKPTNFYSWDMQKDLDSLDSIDSSLAAVVPWLAPFWLAGVWIFYLGQISGWISIGRLRRRGVCCAPNYWQIKISQLSAQLRLSQPVQLLESCLADVPLVLGHFRPVILMPVGLLAGLPPEQIEAILLHELAHIRRYDYLLNMLQRLVEGLLFYHPAVWWISRLIRTEREKCCDDLVVAMNGNAHEFAAALIWLEQNRWPSREPAVAATGGSLMKRIHRLLYPKKQVGAWTPSLAAGILITTAMVASAAWQSGPSQQSPALAQAQTDRAETSPYVKWLNQEVIYIITDEERTAFQKLTTNEERDKFIEQFWQRRDPTAGTAENEFKTEHYRRIMYVKERFQTQSGKPGWQTDRGHLYIVYGPPDEIESHPVPPIPSEVWMYRHLEGIGDNIQIKYIDQTGKGDYRFAPGNPPNLQFR